MNQNRYYLQIFLLSIVLFNVTFFSNSVQGQVWNQTTIPNTFRLNHVTSASGAIYASAQGGNLYRSDDFGASWVLEANRPNTSSHFNEYIVFGSARYIRSTLTAFRSTNNGASWTQINNISSAPVTALEALGNNRLLMARGSDVRYSTSNGNGWSLSTLNTGGNSVNDFSGTSLFNIWAVGDGGVIRNTTNGYLGNWINRDQGTTNWKAIDRFQSSWVVIVGEGGNAVYSGNSGFTWTTLNTGTTEDLVDVDMHSISSWTIVGDQGTILFTDDSGATFTTVASNTTTDLKSVVRSGVRTVAVGNGGDVIYYSPAARVTPLILTPT